MLPGIGPVSGIAILLPLTTVLPPTSAIIMMAAIYYGAMYGGSTTAIVVNIPGEASSVPTAMDGYEMAKQGKAGPALAISAISSFVAGTLSVIGLTFFAPMLADFAVVFGPPEYFALMFMGLSLVISLSGRALLKGVISMALGLTAALIGQDPLTGAARLTFGSVDPDGRGRFHQRDRGALRDQRGDDQRGAADHRHQRDGDQELDADLGRYQAVHGDDAPLHRRRVLPGAPPRVRPVGHDVRGLRSREAGLQAPRAVRQGGDRGGRRPGGGEQRHLHRRVRPALLVRASHGALDGGPARRADDVRPPARADALRQNPEFVWAVIASMYIGNVMLLVLNLPLVGMWARIVRIPFYILGPLIVFCAVVGTYSIRFQTFDVWVMLLFGVIGYFMRKLGFPIAPMVLASVLAQMLETVPGAVAAHLAGVAPDLLHPPHLGRVHGARLPLHRPGDLGSGAGQGAGGGHGGCGLIRIGTGRFSKCGKRWEYPAQRQKPSLHKAGD